MAARIQNLVTEDQVRRAHEFPIYDVVARHVALRRDGRDFVGRCPFHQERTPSFRVYSGGNNFHCFGCGAHGDAIDFLRETQHLDFLDAIRVLVPEDGRHHSRTASVAKAVVREACGTSDQKADRERTERALEVFSKATQLPGTIGMEYLVRRLDGSLEHSADIRHRMACEELIAGCGDIRFAKTCVRNFNGNLETHPALVALLRDVHTNDPLAIQRIFLKPNGSDRLRDKMGKATQGPASGTCVKLSKNEEVTFGLGISEGIEKGLAVMSRGWSPMWVTCGTGGLEKFPTLKGIGALTVFADNDAPGQKAARGCAQRWADAGGEARIVTPKIADSDWNDALNEATR
jgi:DNA primase